MSLFVATPLLADARTCTSCAACRRSGYVQLAYSSCGIVAAVVAASPTVSSATSRVGSDTDPGAALRRRTTSAIEAGWRRRHTRLFPIEQAVIWKDARRSIVPGAKPQCCMRLASDVGCMNPRQHLRLLGRRTRRDSAKSRSITRCRRGHGHAPAE